MAVFFVSCAQVFVRYGPIVGGTSRWMGTSRSLISNKDHLMRGAPLKNSRQDSILSSISRTLVDRNLVAWNTAIRAVDTWFFLRSID